MYPLFQMGELTIFRIDADLWTVRRPTIDRVAQLLGTKVDSGATPAPNSATNSEFK
jgi:hypothetical protein